MSAVAAAPTSGVDTLAAWLAAYLAAPSSAGKGSFTVPELLAVAGMPRNAPNASAMGRALKQSGLVVGKRNQGKVRQWAWFRPHLAAKRPAPAPPARRMVMHHTTGNAAFLPGHTEGDRRFTVFDPSAPEGDTTGVCIGSRTIEGWRFELGGLLRVPRSDAAAIKAFISQTADKYRAPFPPVPAPSLDDLEARAREAVQATAERAAARHMAFYREGSLDILGRLSCAIAIHQLQALAALNIPEPRP